MNPLIDVTELAEHLDSFLVLDCQWTLGGPPGRLAFQRAHLPGAAHLDLDADLAGPPGPAGRHPLPDPDVLQAALRRCGVEPDGTLVVYDDRASMAAARAWWTLRWAGLTRVRVLDGGLAAWQALGHPVESGPQTPRALGTVTVRAGSLPVLDADTTAALARTGIVLDARAGERYRGEVEPIDPVAGHIPGAISAPTTDNLDVDGRFLPPVALRERFAAVGLAPGGRAGTYCGSGVTAAHQALALALAGIDAEVYVGSWSHWVTDPARPVATGPTPG